MKERKKIHSAWKKVNKYGRKEKPTYQNFAQFGWSYT